MNLKHPGQIIRENILLPRNLSITEAAKLLGVTRSNLSNLINGKISLSRNMAQKFKQTFNVDYQKLLDVQQQYDSQRLSVQTDIVSLQYVPQLLHVRAKDIENLFTHSLTIRSELAVMLRLLIHSVSTKIMKIDFPGYDNAERSGWDGWVEQGSVNPWIPVGKSGWEFGVSKDIRRKADHDYEKSIKENLNSNRRDTTFVFVTPRSWPGKVKWVKQKKQENQWKDVRAYDSSDLEQWIEQSLAGQVWLSEKVGNTTLGVKSLDACWHSWCDVTEPPFPGRLFEIPIQKWEKELRNFLKDKDRHRLYLKADSTEEALAFLYQSFSVVDELKNQRGHVLVLEKKEPISKVMLGVQADALFVITSREVEFEFAKYSNRVKSIIVYPSNASLVNEGILLQPLAREDIRNVLREELEIPEDRLNCYCDESGGSLTVLRRRMSTSQATRYPYWANNKALADSLIPMALIGIWNAGNIYDQRALMSVSECKDFQVIEKQINELLLLEDTPLWSLCYPMERFQKKIIQGVISKMDAIYAVSPYVTRSVLERFFDVAKKILSNEDLVVDFPDGKNCQTSACGLKPLYSSELRRSVAETVALMAAHGRQLFDIRLGTNSNSLVNNLIDCLLTPLTSKSLESNNDVLAIYAEAAPDVLLSSLETTLKEKFEELNQILRPGSTSIIGAYCPRQGLLDALAILAWDPRLFPRVVDVLGDLADVEISDNYGNTPLELLSGLFCSWFPQTKANLNVRERVFSRLFLNHRKVCWQVAMRQIRVSNQSSISCHIKPKWNVDVGIRNTPVNDEESCKFVEFVIQQIFSSDLITEEIIDLVGRIKVLTVDQQDIFWGKVKDWLSKDPSDEEIACLREEIRRKLKQSCITPLGRTIIEQLTPKNLICWFSWLFKDNWVKYSAEDRPVKNYEERFRNIEEDRINALKTIVNSLGIKGIYELVQKGDCQFVIGTLLIKGRILTREQLHNLIKESLNLTDYKELLCGALEELFDMEQFHSVLNGIKENLSEEEALRLFLLSPYDKAIWDSLKLYPSEFQELYWDQVKPRLWVRSDSVNESTQQLLKAKRPLLAFQISSLCFEFMKPELLDQLLEQLINFDSPGIEALDAEDVRKAFCVLESNSDLSIERKAQLELSYVRYLVHCYEGKDNQIPNIEKLIEQSPQFFVNLVKQRIGITNSKEIGLVKKDTVMSANCYLSLEGIKKLPFESESNVEIRKTKLENWVETARNIAKDQSCLDWVDYFIGDYLAKSSVGVDGIWPEESVRNVLEITSSPKMIRGCFFRKINSRGVTTLNRGGDLERRFTAQLKDWCAKLTEEGMIVTVDLLSALVSAWENEAKYRDVEVALRNRLSF